MVPDPNASHPTTNTGTGGASANPSDPVADGGPLDAGETSDAGDIDGAQPDAGTDDTNGTPCGGGMMWLASDVAGSETRVQGEAEMHFDIPTSTQIIGLQTTLTVPAKPAMASTLYAWPGIEPGRWDNIEPVGQGVLQPVLTWGTSCGSYAPANPKGWWISPQYVNPYTSLQSVYGCMGGDAIFVEVGDALDISMSLEGTVWSQIVADRQTQQMTTFDMDLMGQTQNWALFEIEMPTANRPNSDVIFTATILTFADPAPEACQPSQRGTNDYFATPQSSADGTKCCISRIVLRADGVPATSPDGP
jgi:hypothetical protein